MGKACVGGIVAAAVVACMAAAGPPANAKAQVTMRLGPEISMEPGAVRITTLVEPDERNRSLVIEVESVLHYRSSTMQLDGEDAARSHAIWVRNLPAGEYEVRVRLQQEPERERVFNGTFQVVGRERDSRLH